MFVITHGVIVYSEDFIDNISRSSAQACMTRPGHMSVHLHCLVSACTLALMCSSHWLPRAWNSAVVTGVITGNADPLSIAPIIGSLYQAIARAL